MRGLWPAPPAAGAARCSAAAVAVKAKASTERDLDPVAQGRGVGRFFSHAPWKPPPTLPAGPACHTRACPCGVIPCRSPVSSCCSHCQLCSQTGAAGARRAVAATAAAAIPTWFSSPTTNSTGELRPLQRMLTVAHCAQGREVVALLPVSELQRVACCGRRVTSAARRPVAMQRQKSRSFTQRSSPRAFARSLPTARPESSRNHQKHANHSMPVGGHQKAHDPLRCLGTRAVTETERVSSELSLKSQALTCF
jgi:hypothetical protein